MLARVEVPGRRGFTNCAVVRRRGKDGEMGGMASLRFGVEKPKIKWGTYLRDAIRSRGSASGQFQDYSGGGPSVVVHNQRGEVLIIEVTQSVKHARDRAAALEKEYEVLGASQWCARYDVPISFVSG